MPIYSSLVCDGHKDSPCKVENGAPVPEGHSISFEHLEETWGTMVAFVAGSGWEVVGGPGQESMKFYCPKHKRTTALHEFESKDSDVPTYGFCTRCGLSVEHRNHKEDR